MLPESLVSPKMWNTYVDLLEGVLLENLIKTNSEHIEKNSRELKHALFENFLDVKQRNEAMVFKGLTAESSVQLVTAVSSVKVSSELPLYCLVIDNKYSFLILSQPIPP